MSPHQAPRWVVKIGTSLLTDQVSGLNLAAINEWVRQIAELRRAGVDVVLVSSGSIGEGMQRLGWQQRPQAVNELQAAAAVGQMGLVQHYATAFKQYDLLTAQVLLTNDDMANRRRYINARATISTLLDHGVVPIINENDTVVTEEIRVGDNDNLAALAANLVDANLLLILTDQHGLHESDPRSNPAAPLISEANADDDTLLAKAGSAGQQGQGGMLTKIQAARTAARSGTPTVITWGRHENVMTRLHQGEALGTRLLPAGTRINARKQWLAGQLHSKGTLQLDDGAVAVLLEQGRSLLAIGVVGVTGEFSRGELVTCVDKHGIEVARGLVNYNATDTGKVTKLNSAQMMTVLEDFYGPELIHRDNIVVTR